LIDSPVFKTYIGQMRQKLTTIVLSFLLFSLAATPTSANEILWNPGVGNDLSGKPANLVPGAAIRNTGLLVYKSNPDELIMKIVMNDSFEQKPFSSDERNMAMWIYWPKNYCWSDNQKNCDGLFTVPIPNNPTSYPYQKSNQFVYVNQHQKASNVDVKRTECKAFWWMESTYRTNDTWAFALSITCLAIPKEFGWYAYSQINLGQADVATDFTQVQTISYPFHDLAAKAYKEKLANVQGEGKNMITCVIARTAEGYDQKLDFDEQCSESSKWELTYCDAHPKAELQVFKSGKWRKLKSYSGKKDACIDSKEFFEFTVSGAFSGKHRIRNFGNQNYQTSFLDIRKSRPYSN